ncbi:MAG: hypothetical protein ABSF37_05875 [Sedimentisphaerales bacterium]
MPLLYSYVVDHDTGKAPNPWGGYCTLVHCKFQDNSKRRNIVELAKKGDWILGTGGESKQSAGNKKIIYLMCVDEKLPFKSYLSDKRFIGREDCRDDSKGNKFALVSKKFYYFGKNAIDISKLPGVLQENLEKKGRGYRKDYPLKHLEKLCTWFSDRYKIGTHGTPCKPCTDKESKCPGKCRQSSTGNLARGKLSHRPC